MNGDRKKLLVKLLFLSFLLLVLNVTALKFHLYWTTWWMDIINHFLGGVIVAYSYIIVCRNKTENLQTYSTKSFCEALILIFCVGVLWELFEIYFGLTFIDEKRYWGDTTLDMIMDIFGMIVGYVYLLKKK